MEHIIGRLLQDYEHGKVTRRQLIQTLALAATAASTARTAEAAAPGQRHQHQPCVDAGRRLHEDA